MELEIFASLPPPVDKLQPFADYHNVFLAFRWIMIYVGK